MTLASLSRTAPAGTAPAVSTAEVRFVIVAARRTGSNLLCTLLDSHPEVLCHHELFNPGGIFYALGLRDGGFSLGELAQRAADPLAFLARIWEHPLGKRCVGFKMTRGQDPRVFEAILADARVRVIVLRRANRIKAYVSERRAELTRRWEVYKSSDIDASCPPVRVDAAALLASIAQNESFYAEVDAALARSARPALQLTYERLFERAEQQRMLAFLGLRSDRVTLNAASVKQNSCDLRDLIENHDALARELAGSALAAELADRGL